MSTINKYTNTSGFKRYLGTFLIILNSFIITSLVHAQTDVLYVEVNAFQTTNLCPTADDIQTVIDVKYLMCDTDLNPSSVSFDDSSRCINYTAGNITNQFADTLCLVAFDISGNSDTTIYIVSTVPVDVCDGVVADAGPDVTICLGESTVLTGNIFSGNDYNICLWSTGESTQQITVSPTETTDYFATIFDNNGCSDIDTVTVFVNNCSDPCDGLVADAGPDVTICLGDSTVLTGNIFSGNDYNICLWSTGDTTQEITVSPTETTDYFATIFDNNGCSDIDTVTVFVNNCSDPCDGVVADAGPDVAICLGDSTVLTGNIFSGNDYNICLWSTGDTTQEITVSPTETTDYFATIFDNNGCSDIDTVTVFVEDCSDTLQCADSTQCVFPGDGNKNFSVNNYDLLDIGYSYGTTGPVRENASIVAEFQEAVDWNQFGIEGIDLKHADCNGDGIISNLDVEAIEANYMLLEGDGERIVDINDGVSIELVFSSDTLAVDTLINDSSYLEIEAEIVVNNLDPATPIYGLAFQINFSDENLELNNAYANWEENSWLTSNNEFISIQKFIPEFNRLDVAISRTDGLAVSGQGRIATVVMIIEDIIISRFSGTGLEYKASISNVIGIGSTANAFGAEDTETDVVFTAITSGLTPSDWLNNNIKVYPNPVSNQLMVASNIDMSSIQIFSLEGRLVKQVLDNMSIDMSDLPANQYIVKIITKEGVLMKRVVKVND